MRASAVPDALTAIVGHGFLRDDPASRARYAVDGLLPRWVAFAGSVREVSELLAVATEERLAVAPRGSGTRTGLGNMPSRVDLALDLSRLAQVVEYAPDDLTVTVGAGVTLRALSRDLSARRQFLPLDPLDGTGRTVGGVVATDSSGPLLFRYGTARDLLLGIRFVQADGTITWGGSKVVKSVSGYDMPKLMVGALGTLGVLVEMTLRLHPAPETERSWLSGFGSAGQAGEFLQRVLDSCLEPSRLEFLSGEALRASGEAGGWASAVALAVGSAPEAVESQGESALALARSLGGEGREVRHPLFWAGLGRAIYGDGDEPDVVLRVTTLPSELVQRATEIETIGRELGLRTTLVAEAGNGTIHVRLSGPLPPEAWDRSLITPLRERLTAEGGSCVVEEAARALKERLDVWGPPDPGAFAIMRRLKSAFDPHSVLNPGRFVGRL